MQYKSIRKALVIGLVCVMITSGILPALQPLLNQETMQVSASQETTCECTPPERAKLKMVSSDSSAPKIFFDEKTQRTTTRFDNFYIIQNDQNHAQFRINLDSTYGSMITCHLISDLGDPSSVDYNDYINLNLYGDGYHEDFNCGEYNQQDVGVIHDSILLTGIPHDLETLDVTLYASGCSPYLAEGSFIDVSLSDNDALITSYGGDYYTSYTGSVYNDPDLKATLVQSWVFAHGYHFSFIPDPDDWTTFVTNWRRAQSSLTIFNYKGFFVPDYISSDRKADVNFDVTYFGTTDTNTVYPVGCAEWGYQLTAGVSTDRPPFGQTKSLKLDKDGSNLIQKFIEEGLIFLCEELCDASWEAAAEVAGTTSAKVGAAGIGVAVQLLTFSIEMALIDKEVKGIRELRFSDVPLQPNTENSLWISLASSVKAGGAAAGYVNFLYSGEPFLDFWNDRENLHERGIWLHSGCIYFDPVELPIVNINYNDPGPFREGQNLYFSAEVIKGDPDFTFEWYAVQFDETGNPSTKTLFRSQTGVSNYEDSFYYDDLTPGKYLIVCKLIDGNLGWDNDSTIVEILDPPEAPSVRISATETNYNTIFFIDWDEVDNAVYYKVEEQLNDGSWYTHPAQGGYTFKAFSKNLSYVDDTYHYRVIAYDKLDQHSLDSNIVDIEITAPPLGALILDVKRDRIGTGQVYSVVWEYSGGFVYGYNLYEYQWKNLCAGEGSSLALEQINSYHYDGTQNLAYDPDLGFYVNSVGFSHYVTDHTVYEYRVEQLDEWGNPGELSNYDGIVIVREPQSATRLLAPTSNVAVNIPYKIYFKGNVTDADEYCIWESTVSNFLTYTEKFTNDTNYFWFDNSAPGTYYYKMRAENVGGEGPFSNMVTKTVVAQGTTPGTPILSSNTSMVFSGDTYTLSWDHVDGECIYKLKESTSSSFQQSQTTEYLLGGLHTFPPTSYTFAHTQDGSQTYYYEVKGISVGSEGSYSNVVAVDVIGAQAPPTPVIYDPGYVRAAYQAYDVSWEPMENVQFQVEENTDPSFPISTTTYGTFSGDHKNWSSQFGKIMHTPSSSTPYYYRIRAIRDSDYGFSPWSSTVDMLVLVPDCTALGLSPPIGTPIITSPITGANLPSQQIFTITWTSVPGATFYNLQKGEFVAGQWIWPTSPTDQILYSGLSTSASVFLPQAFTNPPAAFRVIAGNYCGLARQSPGGPLNWGSPIYVNLQPPSGGGGNNNPGGISHDLQQDITLFLGTSEGRSKLGIKLDNNRFSDLLFSNGEGLLIQNSLGEMEDGLKGVRHTLGVSFDDFDEDFDIDVALVSNNNQSVRIYDGFGGLVTEYTGLLGAYGVNLGDYNDDDFCDIAISEYERGNVTIYDNSRATLLELNELSGPLGVCIGDFNNDGSNDVAVAEYTKGWVGVYSNTGELITRFDGIDGPMGVTIKDFSRDGYNDLAVATEEGPIIIYFGYVDHQNDMNIVSTYDPFESQTIDECLALPLPSSSIYDYYDPGYETILTRLIAPLGTSVGDFGNDGSKDIAVSNANGVRVFNQNGQLIQEYIVPNTRDVCIGDFNNDELNDVAISSETGFVRIYRTNGQILDEFNGLTNPWGVSIGDFDTNGLNDIAIVQTGRVTVFNQNHELLREYSGLTNPRGVNIDDENRDGYNEIIVSDETGSPSLLPVFCPFSPPYQPSSPTPDHMSTNCILTSDLSWTGGDPDSGETIVYDVYFGDTANLPLLSSHQSSTSFNLPTLSYDTTYYWQIVSWDSSGLSTLGPVWSFTTKTNNAPTIPLIVSPTNGADNVIVNSDLSWSCSDPDPEDILTYDVYLGYAPTQLTLVSQDQTQTTYDPGTMHDNTTYFWMIRVHDSFGHAVTSTMWYFTTETIAAGGIAGFWQFEEGSGTIAHDSSPNLNDGTITGATWTTGCQGTALYFHGGGQWTDGDCVTVPHSSSLAITGPFTIEAYIKATGTDNYLAIVDKYQRISESDSRGFTLYLTNGRLRFSVYCGSHGNSECWGTTDLRDNVCHLVKASWDGSLLTVFVDEQPQGQVSWAWAPGATTQNIGIGKRLSGWGGYLPFLGVLDEVKITTSLPLLSIQGGCYYPDMQPVDDVDVTVLNLNTSESWDAETTTNQYTLSVTSYVDVHQGEILRFIAWDQNESVNITDHVVTASELSTGTLTQNLIVNVHYRDLKQFPWYLSAVDTGATVAQMMLNYLMWNSTLYAEPPMTYDDQRELFIAMNTQGGSYLNADELCQGLNMEIDDLGHGWIYGYFFAVYNNTSPLSVLNQICYWLDYPVEYYNDIRDVDVPKPGHPNHVPVCFPMRGSYNNWVVVRGIHTDRNAWLPPSQLNVYGFWLNDPKPGGLGSNTYVTVQRFLEEYFTPVTVSGDAQNGKYVAITDPPREIPVSYAPSDIVLKQSPAQFTKSQAALLSLLNTRNIGIINSVVTGAAYNAASEVLRFDPVYAQPFSQATRVGTPRYQKTSCQVTFGSGDVLFTVLIGRLDGRLLEIQITTLSTSDHALT